MKLVCIIGSARLKDGRCITQGEEFDVKGKEAQTLLDHGYAEKYVKPTVTNTPVEPNADADTTYADDAPNDEKDDK